MKNNLNSLAKIIAVLVELPLGATVEYLIDKDTLLPAKVMAKFKMYGKEYTTKRDLFD